MQDDGEETPWSHFSGLFPAQFSDLFDINPDLDWFEMHLSQGRWQERFGKMINGRQNVK